MKTLITFISILIISSCGSSTQEYAGEKYVVETRVQLKEGSVSKVLELFKSTNPELVSSERDWIRASFASNDELNIVVVRAEWKNKESYLTFSNSSKFKETMRQFGQYFEEKPQVTITKVLFEM